MPRWIYGKHAVKAAILNNNRKILKVLLLPQNESLFSEIAGRESCSTKSDVGGHGIRHVKIEIVDKKHFSAVFGKDVIHQGCAALVEDLSEVHIEDLPDDDRPIVCLDQVSDPQNIGSILRASAVFGAKAVITPETNAPAVTSAVIKVASGAAETIPLIRVKNLVNTTKMLKKEGYWCLGLDERAERKIYETDLNGKFVVIIGSEGHGMRRLTREHCDFLVKLPSFGKFLTLNAAQAATVSLYEILRQHQCRSL